MRGSFATIARLTFRQLVALRSGVVVLLFAALPMLLAALRQLRADPQSLAFVVEMHTSLIVPAVLPIVALIFGTGAFGTEVEEGTILYLLTKPIPRWRIALAKLATVMAMTAAVTVLSSVAAGLIAFRGPGPDRVLAGFAAGVAVGSILYCALFVALSLLVRRSIIVGLLYVIVWEGVAAATFAGTRALSIGQYVLTTADRIVTSEPGVFAAALPASTALPMALVILVLSCFVAVARLRTYQLAGS